jgi:hypothetical protein
VTCYLIGKLGDLKKHNIPTTPKKQIIPTREKNAQQCRNFSERTRLLK